MSLAFQQSFSTKPVRLGEQSTMQKGMRKYGVLGYIILAGALVTLLAIAANASAVWGS